MQNLIKRLFFWILYTTKAYKNNTYAEFVSKLKMLNLLQKANKFELNAIFENFHIFGKINC
ncbi:conserved hypothetical protein [Leptospira interrogans serovar Manilae]|uniref:Uncharacterized protein n=1 Tax=Leptospira interrogans serovar Manilae TaxID=214675 RepID=A0AAQ1SMW2_LEPIR|nr:hypothetical protein LIMLP_01820 [Leptospira interrogans serovar Manilae]AKP28591.1 hypothetical protein LIMHP_01815 [Leptospira interrogans serovar Manilae]EYU62838.1 hypothetical protein CI00_17950 [Leptospira interrogans serovar Manilae]SOR60681.1 conserved hypothetical protein [Leptospira interrogans serovar Manilae]